MRKMGGSRNDGQLNKSFDIGTVRIKNPITVAPMAGVTDYPYRQILAQFSPGLIGGEMVSAKGLLYDNRRTKKMVVHHNQRVPYSQQIFGHEPDIMAAAAQIIEGLGVDLLDINMGCPAPKIVKNGDGAALLLRPNLVRNIVSQVVDSVDIPVTAKIRTGFDANTIKTVEIAEIVQEAGAHAVIVHGRTCEQQYSGEADWNEITKASDRLEIPVIGNGDIFTPLDAVEAMETSDCDGVMLGRGVQGDPWLIEKSKHILMGVEAKEYANHEEIKTVIKEHFNYAVDYYGSKKGIVEMREHISWYLKGLPNSTETKDKVMRMNDEDKIINTIEKYFDKII